MWPLHLFTRAHIFVFGFSNQTRLQTQFFADAVGWSDEAIVNPAIAEEVRQRTSLIERSFKEIDGSQLMVHKVSSSGIDDDRENLGLMASEEMVAHRYGGGGNGGGNGSEKDDPEDMTMSDYHDLLSENMKQKYFPKGHIVYRGESRGVRYVGASYILSLAPK